MRATVVIAFGAMSICSGHAAAQQPCERLTGLKLPYAAVTSAQAVPAGPVSSGGRDNSPPLSAPARCVVHGIIRPTHDSEIRFELWLPAAGWNGKYVQRGNGGWAGNISEAGLVEPVLRGYAASA